MPTLWIDLETYCEVPITHGTHAYAAHAEVTLFAWALDDGPVSVWDCMAFERPPAGLLVAIAQCTEVCAHNSHFDRTVLRHAMPEIANLLSPDGSAVKWRDTMAKALAHSLPGALGDLCNILRVPSDKAKDKEGRALVMLFCKPRPVNSTIRRATRETHPTEWKKFISYAGNDIEAMRCIDKLLPDWNYKGAELDLWRLDQKINDRGVAMDVELAHAAMRAVDAEQKILSKRAKDITNGEVQAATQRDAMLKHILAEYGVTLPDMQGATLERRIQDPDLPQGLRELLGIRLQASTTSTAKYRTLARGVSTDGRLRGTLQFCGASRTGRFAGRLFQPQNLPRPTLKQPIIEMGIDALKADCADLVVDNVMALTSSVIRGCIVAPQGRKLVVADLSNIEGRVAAWLCGESWKLQAFREFDAKIGPDLYKMAYAKSFGIKPEQVNDEQRQVGKVQELALAYQGGVGAFVTFASAYSIDLEALGEAAYNTLPTDILLEANKFYEWTKDEKRPTFGLTQRAFVVCDGFKRLWRQAHPGIAAMWPLLEQAVRNAIATPKAIYEVGCLKVQRTGAWLRIRLPSGRLLCYPHPEIVEGKITYMGVNQYTRKWERLGTYGGKLFENITQGVARDIMTANMPFIEQSGFDIVLSVHDELITETENRSEISHLELSDLLATNPPWSKDLPLAAAGFEATRYRK